MIQYILDENGAAVGLFVIVVPMVAIQFPYNCAVSGDMVLSLCSGARDRTGARDFARNNIAVASGVMLCTCVELHWSLVISNIASCGMTRRS